MPLADPRSVVAARPTKPVAAAWAKKVPTPISIRPVTTATRLGNNSSGRPPPAKASAAQMVGDAGRDQPADQIARYIAGDVGGECTAGVRRAAFLAKISERQRESGSHAKTLRDAQDRKRGEIRRDRKQRRRDREHAKTD